MHAVFLFEDVQAMCHLMERGKKCHRDKGGQENDCLSGCTEGPTLCFIVNNAGRMQTFHTCTRDTVEVVGAVMNKQEGNSFRDIIGVCWSFVEECVQAGN